MDDKHPEAIVVNLGGKSRRLKLGPSGFRRAERRGVTFSLTDFANLSVGQIASLVWVGLLTDDPELDEDTVLVWLADSDDEAEILATVYRAVLGMMDGFAKAFGDRGNGQKPRAKAKS